MRRRMADAQDSSSQDNDTDKELVLKDQEDSPLNLFINKWRKYMQKIWRKKRGYKDWSSHRFNNNILSLFYNKSQFCKHGNKSWVLHAAKGGIRNFMLCVVIKFGIELSFRLLRKRKGVFSYMLKLLSFDTMMFGTFWGGYILLFRLLQWSLRKLRNKDDGFNAALSGFLASFWLIVDKSKSRRIQIACYVFARSLDSISKNLESNGFVKKPTDYNSSQVEINKTENDVICNKNDQNKTYKKITSSKFETSWVLTLAGVLTAYTLYCWFYEIDNFPHGVEKAMRIMTQPKPNDWNLVDKICRVHAYHHLYSPMKTSRYAK